jgi:hypothetical protein
VSQPTLNNKNGGEKERNGESDKYEGLTDEED